ncbi:hypothetical protein FACS189459_0890 [Bacilli bacterium]|nr:hypothetical protein FACS189459_0890 [Bacilli bacterium]
MQFQTTTKNFISAIDAHNGAYYCTIFINNKLILKNKLITKKLLDNYLNKFKGIPYFLDVDFSGIKKTEKFPKFKLTNIRNTKGNYIKKPINN